MGIFENIKGFLFQDVSLKLKSTEKAIAKQPEQPVVINRYYTEVTETADQGIYGYSTRDEVLQLRNYSDIERFLKDPKVKSSLDILLSGVFSANLEIVPADDSKRAAKLQRYVADLLNNLTGINGYNSCLEDVLREALVVALGGFGNFFGEIIPKKCLTGEFKDTYLIDRIMSKRPGLLEYITDQFDNIEAIHSLIYFDEYYPVDRFLLVSYGNLFSNPYGTPAFSSAYQYWKAKQIVNKDMQIYSNRYSQPIAFAKFEDTEHSSVASDIANNLFAGANIAMPKSVEAGFIQAGHTGGNPFLVILDWLDKQISMAICGMDLSQGSGSFASDKVKSDERMLMIADLRRKLEDIVNEQIIRRFIGYNFPLDKYPLSFYPKCKFVLQKEEDKAAYIAMVKGMQEVGIFYDSRLSDVNQARITLGFPELSEDEFEGMLTVTLPENEEEEEEQPGMIDVIDPENEEDFSFQAWRV